MDNTFDPEPYLSGDGVRFSAADRAHRSGVFSFNPRDAAISSSQAIRYLMENDRTTARDLLAVSDRSDRAMVEIRDLNVAAGLINLVAPTRTATVDLNVRDGIGLRWSQERRDDLHAVVLNGRIIFGGISFGSVHEAGDAIVKALTAVVGPQTDMSALLDDAARSLNESLWRAAVAHGTSKTYDAVAAQFGESVALDFRVYADARKAADQD
jgi:hypothetical protein